MPKTEIRFLCQNCGYDSPRWLGKCPGCDEWNSFVEEKLAAPKSSRAPERRAFTSQGPSPITKVELKSEQRTSTSVAELDRVLGGGIVSGSVVLVAGEPGIGKSTMMLQIAEGLSKNGSSVLYVSGEESLKQLRLRAERLGTLSSSLNVLPETDLFQIEASIDNLKPKFVIVDSIQTTSRGDLPSAAGSVSQVRECAAYLVSIAKTAGIPIFIVGHVTKEGSIAGPRILEHIVDTVLYFEGERHKQFRIIRGVKNRFGSTNEVGIFEMTEEGLSEVANPSEVFLNERAESSGSVVTATLEGTRPLLVEVQSLVSPTTLQMPRRTVTGMDYNRASIILAVLERRAGFKLGSKDIYINVAGGVRVGEPAADLPLAVSIVSCYRDKPVDPKIVVVGEVGLGGEVRSVSQIAQRVKEASKLGFKKIIIPRGNIKETSKLKGIDIEGVADISEALKASSVLPR
jgi:DNA repair protein RadA/Sms